MSKLPLYEESFTTNPPQGGAAKLSTDEDACMLPKVQITYNSQHKTVKMPQIMPGRVLSLLEKQQEERSSHELI